MLKSVLKIAKIANLVTEKILKEDICFNDFSDFLNETWEHKIKLFPNSENTREILNIYKEAKSFGAKSGKLLGAGGGGFFLFLVEEDLQENFIQSMHKYTVVKKKSMIYAFYHFLFSLLLV